jgi:hypothetical protein
VCQCENIIFAFRIPLVRQLMKKDRVVVVVEKVPLKLKLFLTEHN